MIFAPCCILTHTRAHLFSSAEWHMHRQHRPPGSVVGTGRGAPVNDEETSTMRNTADTTLLVMPVHLPFGLLQKSQCKMKQHLLTLPQDLLDHRGNEGINFRTRNIIGTKRAGDSI